MSIKYKKIWWWVNYRAIEQQELRCVTQNVHTSANIPVPHAFAAWSLDATSGPGRHANSSAVGGVMWVSYSNTEPVIGKPNKRETTHICSQTYKPGKSLILGCFRFFKSENYARRRKKLNGSLSRINEHWESAREWTATLHGKRSRLDPAQIRHHFLTAYRTG